MSESVSPDFHASLARADQLSFAINYLVVGKVSSRYSMMDQKSVVCKTSLLEMADK